MKHTDALAVLRLVHGYHEAACAGLGTFGLNAKFIKDVLEPFGALAKEAPPAGCCGETEDSVFPTANEARMYATIEKLRAENRELGERNESFKQRDDALERLASMRNDLDTARLARDNFETALKQLRARYTDMVRQRDRAHEYRDGANRNLIQMQAERNSARAFIREIADQILDGRGSLGSVIDLVKHARGSFGE